MSSHKYWRFTDWYHRLPHNNYINHQNDILLKEFYAVLSDDTLVTDSSIITFKAVGFGTAAALVDGDVDSAMGSPTREGGAPNWWLQYTFTDAVEIKAIRTIGWFEFGLEIDKVSAYTSDNGVDWTYYGTCFVGQKTADINYYYTPIFGGSAIGINTQGTTVFLDIYSQDESGSFSGLVTQGESGDPRLPLKAEVLLYDRMTNELLQRTWSSDIGAYSFSGLDAGREYYAVTLHPNRTYNAAIQDGLKSGMTT